MTLECGYYIAGIGSFLVAILGLAGLVYYAYETRKLRIAAQEQLGALKEQVRAAQDQLEAAFVPCVVITQDPSNDSVDATLYARNVGAGVALNTRWRYVKYHDKPWIELPALVVGGSRTLPFKVRDVINGAGIECEFEGLGRIRYRTLSSFSETTTDLDLRHQFERLSVSE